MSLGKIADEAGEHALLVTDSLTHRKLHGKGRTITPAGQHRSANADDPALAGGKIALEIAVMAVLVRRRHEPADIRSDYLRFQIAKKLFGGSADRDDDALLVDHDHCIRARRADRCQLPGIRQPRGFGRPLPGGVVIGQSPWGEMVYPCL